MTDLEFWTLAYKKNWGTMPEDLGWAVVNNEITPEEYKQITGQDYSAQ
ncbi:XkdX family protein [Paenibacillus sp. PSB04]|nr:XkdX family protein [Paenibacillus sp. PSB04]UYO04897.1 XkdX family protein [Paenibacillus sp. PSB04]